VLTTSLNDSIISESKERTDSKYDIKVFLKYLLNPKEILSNKSERLIASSPMMFRCSD
jgi:hypothetical protein